jgi:hypothetical protein
MSAYITKDGREKIHEVQEGSVILEFFLKRDPNSSKVFFDYRTVRTFPINPEEYGRGPFCQQRDMRDNIKALCTGMEWVSVQHRIIRDTGELPRFSESY